MQPLQNERNTFFFFPQNTDIIILPDICPVNHSFESHAFNQPILILFYLATIICYLKCTLPRQQNFKLHETEFLSWRQ